MTMAELSWPVLLTAVSLALTAGPLGCLMLWQRMAPLGDTLAHASLLGAAAALLLSLPTMAGIATIGFLLCVGLHVTLRKSTLPPEALLGIVTPVSLALGVGLFQWLEVDHHALETLLFGDIHEISWSTAGIVIFVCFVILMLIIMQWRKWTFIALHPALAAAEGVKLERHRFLQLILLAGFIACALQIAGMLLTVGLLGISAACGKIFARSAGGMMIAAALIGGACAVIGVGSNYMWAVNMGPAIVLSLGGALIIIISIRSCLPKQRR